MIPDQYKSSLAIALNAGDTTTTSVYVNHVTTLTGEELDFSQFTPFTRGIIVVDSNASRDGDTMPEIISFTGIDTVNKRFTGCTRGLSTIDGTQNTDNITYHGVNAPVVISWGSYNIQDLLTYVADQIAGEIGTASDTVSGSTKITEDLGADPRAMAALVSQQSVPDMTLKVNPFAIGGLNFAGGNTGTITAPVTNPRIDLIVYSTASSALAVRGGTESVSPVAPSANNGDIVLAEVYLRVGQTAIYERDSGSSRSYVARWYYPSFSLNLGVPAGTIQDFAGSSVPIGWLDCDGSAISRTTYAALFSAISTTWGAGNGSTTFNIPDLRGRMTISAGAGTKVFTFASRSSNTVTVTGSSNSTTNEVQTGQAVLYSAPSGAMTGLTDNTTYYLIRVAYNQFQLASSLANAIAGTAISLSSDGTGTQTFTITLSTRTLAETGGEELHGITIAEMAAHTHTANYQAGANAAAGGGGSVTSSPGNTGSTGGSTQHNNMSPFAVIKKIIKY